MKIIADHTIPYLKGIVEPFADIQYLPSSQFCPENIKDAEVLIVRSIDKCSEELLQNSQVKLITTATIGFDHIDTKYCDTHGIIWKNAPGCNAASVGQYIGSCLAHTSIRTQTLLAGKTIGIIGAGHVGKEVAKVCKGLGLKVLLNDPPRAEKEGSAHFVTLETIGREADIITLHTPLSKTGKYATFHLANENFFNKFQRKPWFINAARGNIHQTDALLSAKKTGKISEIILDCWENEPFIDPELLSVTSIATPHIAGFSADGKANATRICLENIEAFYGIHIEGIKKISLPPPVNPIIDMDLFKNYRIEHALLSTFNPLRIDQAFRSHPEKFEWFRANYDHPREYRAYSLFHGTPVENKIGKELGFTIL